MTNPKSDRAPWPALLASTLISILLATSAAAQTASFHFDIPGKPLSQALRDYGKISGLDIIFTEDLVEGLSVAPLRGEFSAEDALRHLLKGTGLIAEQSPSGAMMIRRASSRNVAAVAPVGSSMSAARYESVQVRSQAAENEAWATRNAGHSTTGSGAERERRRTIEEIVIIGTNIRGIAPESSPVRIFDREDIQISGVATAEDFIQTLPQNFGGGSNTSAIQGLPNDDSTQFNDPYSGGAGGASVNLHGLGSGATLVLLNGHRLAPSSGIGDFVDISMIPASALERVEVLTDGASSIYGGDAVAGVVNFILRDDFDGAETSLRYGSVTEGDLDQYRANFTGGKDWKTGNALVVYEYFGQEDLSAGDRSFSQNALLPNDLLPKQERHSALASASQEVTPDLELFGDLIFSERKMALDATTDVGDSYRSISKSDSWNISAGGSWAIHNDWIFDTFGTYSNTQTESEWDGITVLVPRTVDSKLWTVDAKVSGTVLQLTGGKLKLAFGGHYRSEEFSNVLLPATTGLVVRTERKADRDAYAFFGEAYIPIVGPDNAMPGLARLAINASGRFDDYSDFGSTTNPKVGVLWSPFEGLNLRGSYSTSFNPPPLGRVGASDLAIAVYPSLWVNTLLGQTPGDPAIADVDIMSVNGTSKNLKAEQSRAFTAGVDFNRQWGNHQISAHSTYFDIKFDGRLGDTPVPDGSSMFNVPNIAFNHPELFPEGTVIFFPTLDQINDVISSADLPLTTVLGADPLNASVIHFTNVVRNLSLTSVRGIDFDVTHTLESGSERGTFLLGLAGTYLIDFEQQAAVTTPTVEQLNTQFNPLDLTLRGRAGYAYNGIRVNLFLNYKPGYRVDNTPGAMRIDSWRTVDLSLSYDLPQKFGDSVFNDTIFRLSVTNLLDNNPPSLPSDTSYHVFGYDPSNASPLGRFVAFELTKGF